MSITIPDGVFDVYYDGVDEMIRVFGSNCLIVYPPLKENCSNCYFNTMPGVGATNRYRPGGPAPFDDGVCPYCNGLGHKLSESSENLKVRAYHDLKTWTRFNPKIAYKAGSAVIIGYMTDVPKFKHMAYIQLDRELAGMNNYRYELTCDPTPWGFGHKYFTTNVGRISGEF